MSGAEEEDDEDERIVGVQLKVAVVGDANVGKTNIIKRFCYNEYSRVYNQTIGADFHIKHVLLLPEKKEVALKITDVGGLELNGTMLDKYLFNSNIIILVYDITNPSSFDYLNAWIDTIANIVDSPPIATVIGNKADVEHERAVRQDRAKRFADDFGLMHYNVSAKTGETVNASITDTIRRHLGMSTMSRAESELQQPIIRAELIPATPHPYKNKSHGKSSRTNGTTVCVVQ